MCRSLSLTLMSRRSLIRQGRQRNPMTPARSDASTGTAPENQWPAWLGLGPQDEPCPPSLGSHRPRHIPDGSLHRRSLAVPFPRLWPHDCRHLWRVGTEEPLQGPFRSNPAHFERMDLRFIRPSQGLGLSGSRGACNCLRRAQRILPGLACEIWRDRV